MALRPAPLLFCSCEIGFFPRYQALGRGAPGRRRLADAAVAVPMGNGAAQNRRVALIDVTL
jgi:hypothetical protein